MSLVNSQQSVALSATQLHEHMTFFISLFPAHSVTFQPRTSVHSVLTIYNIPTSHISAVGTNDLQQPSIPKAPRRQEHTRWSNIASPFPSTSPQQFRGASLTRMCKVMSRGYGSLQLAWAAAPCRAPLCLLGVTSGGHTAGE